MTPPVAPRRPTRWHLPAAVAIAALLAAGCTGPQLTIRGGATDDGPRYVDGQLQRKATLPFRYYGETQVDALPADLDGGRADWSRLPTRTTIAVAEPVSPWLFPFDLPLELLDRLLAGRRDRTVAVETRPNPEPVVTGFQPQGLEALRQRALEARVAR